jgi:hypothetical protein
MDFVVLFSGSTVGNLFMLFTAGHKLKGLGHQIELEYFDKNNYL